MGAMGRLRVFVVQEPVVAASCLIAGFGTLSSPSHLPRESYSVFFFQPLSGPSWILLRLPNKFPNQL
ncbi:hypothetical protein BAE44_0017734 [Dichanthelium oligosanthes]|uniref:Uncharacterized protein n=1 Tax=Dichanthelium oligosanthes TaxID=888268 RepID=A0A1E5V867_9POAL|nr:hypothetical protein BAE44_0017734 [Dichanthelium oligosanthes]